MNKEEPQVFTRWIDPTIEKLQQENKQLKETIDKAIDFVKYLKKISSKEWEITFNDLLEILEGDKE